MSIVDARTSPPAPTEYSEFYARYVARVPPGDIVAQLATQLASTLAPIRGLSEGEAERGYAPGKWTVKEVLGHLSDAERVFAYRALRIARGDTTPLPGFDENAYTPAGRFDDRDINSLISELVAVRSASVALLDSLPTEAWLRSGTASGAAVTVRGLAFIMAGHELHHRAILSERYGIGAASPQPPLSA